MRDAYSLMKDWIPCGHSLQMLSMRARFPSGSRTWFDGTVRGIRLDGNTAVVDIEYGLGVFDMVTSTHLVWEPYCTACHRVLRPQELARHLLRRIRDDNGERWESPEILAVRVEVSSLT